jgi:hypothetical protein
MGAGLNLRVSAAAAAAQGQHSSTTPLKDQRMCVNVTSNSCARLSNG